MDGVKCNSNDRRSNTNTPRQTAVGAASYEEFCVSNMPAQSCRWEPLKVAAEAATNYGVKNQPGVSWWLAAQSEAILNALLTP